MATSDKITGRYLVQATRPDVFLDSQHRPVNGYALTVYFPEYNETHEVRVKSQDVKEAQKAITDLLAWRDNLAALGSE